MADKELLAALGFPEDFKLDHDIAEMNLSEAEKVGVQINRDFNNKVQRRREDMFRGKVKDDTFAMDRLERVVDLLSREDARALPVIFCAFLDEVMLEMYKKEIPIGVPGGRKTLFAPFGPFSNFSGRIKLAFCFRLISPDLLIQIDYVRKARNAIAHGWDVEGLKNYFASAPLNTMIDIEKQIEERDGQHARRRYPEKFYERLSDLDIFRIRLIWIVVRTFYECRYYFKASRQGLDPHKTLYFDGGTSWLGPIFRIAGKATDNIAAKATENGSRTEDRK